MGYESIPASAQSQIFLKNMLWANTWKKSALFSRLFAGVDKSILSGDDMKSKMLVGNSFYPENGSAGAAIGSSGTLSFAEYTFVKKLLAIPINMDLRMQIELDAMNNRDQAAATTARWFRSIIDKANDLVEWMFLGDGSGRIAECSTVTNISNGTVTLKANTPQKVFDKLIQPGTYLVCGTRSAGVVTPASGSSSHYCQGFVCNVKPGAKTFDLAATAALAAAGTADADVDGTTSGDDIGVYFATPSAGATTIASVILAGVGLATTTTDAITMSCMNGIRRTNEYLTGSYTLHGITASNTFNPIYKSGDNSKGLVPGLLSEIFNNINSVTGSDHVIATSNIIWNDWCDLFRTSSFVDAAKEQANFEPGFMVGGHIKPVHAEGYWDPLGVVHGIDTSTHHIIYSQMPFLRDAGTDEVGWSFRHKEVLHPSSSYYGAGNELVYMGNLVSDGRRNQNFVIDSLQTTALYNT